MDMLGLGRSLVALLALAVASASVADCLMGEGATASQMACCTGLDHDCGAMAGAAANDESCCPAEHPRGDRVFGSAAAKIQVAPVLSPAPAVWAVGPPDQSDALAASEAMGREILKLPDRPTYLLVSTFLI